MAKQKHLGWFRQGARTLRAVARERGFEHVFPTDEDWYLCPLCIKIMVAVAELDDGELTVEHAPPEALGGSEIALTCRACNNFAGSKFDAEAHKEHRLRLFFSGESELPETVAFTAGDITTTVDMHITDQTMLLVGVPKINNAANTERMKQYMRMLSGTKHTDATFSVTTQLRYSPDQARVSWIRTAYLAAFALLGWKYILQPALQPIRDQLANPANVTLPPLSMYDPNGDSDRRQLWLVKMPVEHRSLLVVWGQHGIFLPTLNDRRDLEQLCRDLGALTSEPVQYSFTGDMLPWPSGPHHLLDPPPVGP